MSKRFDSRLASKLCAACLLLLFVAGLPTQADAQRRILGISAPATVTEPADPNGKVKVHYTVKLSSGTAPATGIGVWVKVTGGTATKDRDWSFPAIYPTGDFYAYIKPGKKSASGQAFDVLGDLARESDETVVLSIH